MDTFRIYPYKMGSRSATQLAESLGGLKVYPDRAYRPHRGHFLINWGSSTLPNWYERFFAYAELGLSKWINQPDAVGRASNKLSAFRQLTEMGVSVPDWTVDDLVADRWIMEGRKVYARQRLQGHSGEGIVIMDEDNPIVEAPLYTKEVRNNGEYRIHVFNDEIIEYTKKRRRRGDAPSEHETEVRNLANGWIYSRENLRHLPRIEDLAKDAIRALGLDFGAVDIIMDERGQVYVLEVNCAPGLSETRLQAYTNAIQNYAPIQ